MYDMNYLLGRGWKSLPEGWKDPENPGKWFSFMEAIDIQKARDGEYLFRRGWIKKGGTEWIILGSPFGFALESAVAHQAARDEQVEMGVWSSGYDAASTNISALAAMVKTPAESKQVASFMTADYFAKVADNKLDEFRKRFGRAPGAK